MWVGYLVCLHFTGNMVDLVICHLVTTIINTLNQGEPFPPCMHTSLIQLPSISCSPSHPPDNHQDPRWSSLPLPLLEMLLSGRLEGHVEENTRKVSQQRVSDDSCGYCFIDHISLSLSLSYSQEVISQLCLLPNRILTSVNCSNVSARIWIVP